MTVAIRPLTSRSGIWHRSMPVVYEHFECRVIAFPSTPEEFADEPPFSAEDVLAGLEPSVASATLPGRVAVTSSGQYAILRFYGYERSRADRTPVIFLAGDVLDHCSGSVVVNKHYRALSPRILQTEASDISAKYQRTFIHLARPGIYGSSGHHLQRRRQLEVDLIDGAITCLSKSFAWKCIDLAGLSGGGHVVACLLARRTDVRRAVIASGNVAVRQRFEELGLKADVTGFSDFVDPIDLVDQVAKNRPEEVVLVTDPYDCVIPSRLQKAYADQLRAAGCDVDQKFVMSKEQTHHILFWETIREVFA